MFTYDQSTEDRTFDSVLRPRPSLINLDEMSAGGGPGDHTYRSMAKSVYSGS